MEEEDDEDLPKLSNLYRDHQKEAPHVFSLINTCIAWRKKKPNSNYVTFFGVKGDWLESGRFILLMQYSCCDIFIYTLEGNGVLFKALTQTDIFIYTLEGNGQILFKALTQTKKIEWTKQLLIYGVNGKHISTAFDVLDERRPGNYITVINWVFVIDKEKALTFEIECPDDVYIGKLDQSHLKLNQSHLKLVNSHWPHRFEGSEEYLGTYVEMNNCYGIFLKSNDELVCWIMKNNMGQLSVLQTLPEYTRKGYATILTKMLSKEIAEEGHHPLATIVVGNIASEMLFKKLGFRKADICIYFECP
ncbi:FR47-like protein [Popillia japonica]|uniref:FR47-like protein n=1 Tax=Popillia japonica TaxID=7064 RepID=A0AAW1IW37_POPJA